MPLIARLPPIRGIQRHRRRRILRPIRQRLISRSCLPQRRRHALVLSLRRLQLALHRRELLIHRSHNQMRPRRRPTQRRTRRPDRTGLITNHPRGQPALLTNRRTLPSRLLQLLIKTRHTNARLLIRPSGSEHPGAQPTPTIRRRRHRSTLTRSRQLATLTNGWIQVVRARQDAVHTRHEGRDTHPTKLTRRHRPRPHPAPGKQSQRGTGYLSSSTMYLWPSM